MHRVLTILAILLVSSAWLGGPLAAAKRPPDFRHESFSPQEVDVLFLLPAADLRQDKDVELTKLNQIFQKTARRFLKKFKYEVTATSTYGAVAEITVDDLELAAPSWVERLGPEHSRWIVLTTVEDLTTKTGAIFGARAGVICAAYLFDKQSGLLMWREEALAKAIGVFWSKKAARGDSMRVCSFKMMKSFPHKNKG